MSTAVLTCIIQQSEKHLGDKHNTYAVALVTLGALTDLLIADRVIDRDELIFNTDRIFEDLAKFMKEDEAN